MQTKQSGQVYYHPDTPYRSPQMSLNALWYEWFYDFTTTAKLHADGTCLKAVAPTGYDTNKSVQTTYLLKKMIADANSMMAYPCKFPEWTSTQTDKLIDKVTTSPQFNL